MKKQIKNNDYDFDLILSNEDFKRNREKCLKVVKKYKLKKWVKTTLWIILGAVIGIVIYQLFTIKEVNETSGGRYECRGGVIKVCAGNNEITDFLGI